MKKRNLQRRSGSSVTEVIVAAALLLSMFGLVVPTTIRAGRVLRDARHYQMAMNELSNQYEYLSSLSDPERAVALNQLQVSEQVRHSLENAKLEASLATTGDGLRLTLSLNWNRGLAVKPVQIMGWLSTSITDLPSAALNVGSRKEGLNDQT